MAIYKGAGGTNIAYVKKGSDTCDKVYQGSTEIWVRPRTYAEFLTHIATLAQQRASSSNSLFTTTRKWQLYGFNVSGTMEGSPWNSNGKYRYAGSSSTYRRPVQHAVESQAVYNAIVSNGREIFWDENGGDLPGPYSARSRNGYTSGSYSWQWAGCQLKRILYWDDLLGKAREGVKTDGVTGIVYSDYTWA